MGFQFNAPPNWPKPPEGWVPPADWRPDASWGPVPDGWQLWLPAQAPAPAMPEQPLSTPNTQPPKIGLFTARSTAVKLSSQLVEANTRSLSLTDELERLKREMDRLGVLSILELEQRRQSMSLEISQEAARMQQQLTDHAKELESRAHVAEFQMQQRQSELQAQQTALQASLESMRLQVVVVDELVLMQEAGIYQYRHPLADAVAYQAKLSTIQDQIKAMTKKDGGAVEATNSWTVNGSAGEGRAMVRDFSKLMLRAYNAEADNLVRGMKAHRLDGAIDRLTKVATTIAKLGKTMNIRISAPYHKLRVSELELTADHQQKLAEEKERDREEKTRLREERAVQQEIERERVRLEKERQHYMNAFATMAAKGDTEATSRLQQQIDEVERAISDVDYRAANIRAGYVYVISNLGAFGEKMVKVGMTRRLDPLDRIRELSDASVPFNFDVHALFFANDAVGIEASMHSRLASQRVNRVNLRREFFYATPQEAKQHLLELAGDLLEYVELPNAEEYRQSLVQSQLPT